MQDSPAGCAPGSSGGHGVERATVTDVVEQHGYHIRMEWGREGVATLAPVCAVVVVVDVLSFSTAVDVAVGRCASVLPLRWTAGQPPDEAAVPVGVVVAGRRGSGAWSLSPSSLVDLPAGTRFALPSPNGATLSAAAAGMGAVVMAGCLRNAAAVAGAAAALHGAIGVIAAGERWPDGGLRPAAEDLIGAGAVVAALVALGVTGCSPEAAAAADAFDGATRRGLAAQLSACSSGR